MEDYGRRIVVDLPFDTALVETTLALRAEGLDIAGTLNVHDYLRRTLGRDFRRYVLFEVTSPELMVAALTRDLCVGAILPVTIAVYELPDGETAVVMGEPFAPVLADEAWRQDAPELARLADHATEQLARVLSRLQHLARQPHAEALAS